MLSPLTLLLLLTLPGGVDAAPLPAPAPPVPAECPSCAAGPALPVVGDRVRLYLPMDPIRAELWDVAGFSIEPRQEGAVVGIVHKEGKPDRYRCRFLVGSVTQDMTMYAEEIRVIPPPQTAPTTEPAR